MHDLSSPFGLSRLLRRLHPPRVELPVLDVVHPEASSGTRISLGVMDIAVDSVRGTAVGGPRLRGADFRPVPAARNRTWQGRWSRLERGFDTQTALPPIDVLAVGDEYWVVDGHNRVALARRRHLGYLDANVVALTWPGGPGLELQGADLRAAVEAGAIQRAAASGGGGASILTPLAAELVRGRARPTVAAASYH
jgi:hypothetical protein